MPESPDVAVIKSSESSESPESDEMMMYPSLYLEWEKPYNLPDEGTMTVRFKKTRSSEDKKNDRYTEDVDVIEILSVKGSGKSDKKSSMDEASDALDKIRDEVKEESEEEDYE